MLESKDPIPHSDSFLLHLQLTALGGFILLFGFLALAGGFRGHVTRDGDGVIITMSIVNTLLGNQGNQQSFIFKNNLGYIFHL